jgi:hypothetical protein
MWVAPRPSKSDNDGPPAFSSRSSLRSVRANAAIIQHFILPFVLSLCRYRARVDDTERASAIECRLRQRHFARWPDALSHAPRPHPPPVLYVTAGRDGPGRKSFSCAWVVLHRLPNEACARPYASQEPARRCRRQRAQRAPRRCIGALRLSRAPKRRVAAFELVGRSVSAQLSSLCPAAQAKMADMRSYQPLG